MPREFSDEFRTNFGGAFQDEDLRFRSPTGATKTQCRLGIEPSQLQERRGESYPIITIVRDNLAHILTCEGIGKKGECPSGGWCAQLGYDDINVRKPL